MSQSSFLSVKGRNEPNSPIDPSTCAKHITGHTAFEPVSGIISHHQIKISPKQEQPKALPLSTTSFLSPHPLHLSNEHTRVSLSTTKFAGRSSYYISMP
jgi:hypothetical protein